MTNTYQKPWKSLQDQISLLTARGMEITDDQRAQEYLDRIGYYRLSGYWFAFRQRTGEVVLLQNGKKPKHVKVQTLALDDFKVGTKFKDVIDLYIFDKKLRLLALDALERIEVSFRVDISHTLGQKDTFAYLNPQCFHKDFGGKVDQTKGISRQHDWINTQARLINRSKEEFIKHHKEKYGLPLAIWIACEVWDFGALSTLYAGMQENDQDTIANKYGVSNGRTFATWIRSLNYLRNVCAHHCRLWNRNMVEQPKLPLSTELPWITTFEQNDHARARCFLSLCMTLHLIKAINPNSSWPDRVKQHLKSFPDISRHNLNLAGMGAPKNWEDIWNLIQK